MTDDPKAGWARDEARKIAFSYCDPDGLHESLADSLADEIESALLAVERRAKEECVRIVEKWNTSNAETRWPKVTREIAERIRSTLPQPTGGA